MHALPHLLLLIFFYLSLVGITTAHLPATPHLSARSPVPLNAERRIPPLFPYTVTRPKIPSLRYPSRKLLIQGLSRARASPWEES